MDGIQPAIRLIVFAMLAVLAVPASIANGSAQPGETVRNEFGPQAGTKANQCRGACGAGCPNSCEKTVSYECSDKSTLRRVVSYDCGTHAGCRVHDDCLDDCLQASSRGGDCQQRCDAEVMQQFGFESSVSWLRGDGPYDGRIQFEYTSDGPAAPEPVYRCPQGARLLCGERAGCLAEDKPVDPVFDSYPGSGAAMRISNFRSGPACGDRVCAQSVEIQLAGKDNCPGGSCTRFGVEFDYRDADPAAPLKCSSSTSGRDEDFIGDLLKQGADAAATRGGSSNQQSGGGMSELLGMFGKVLQSADSPEDVNISMAPLDQDGNAIESERVGSDPREGLPPIPHTLVLPGASGHLYVPMYQLANGIKPGDVIERQIRCTHKDAPVLEVVFRLRSG